MLSLRETYAIMLESERLIAHDAWRTTVRAVVIAGKTTKYPLGEVPQSKDAVCWYGCLTGSATFFTSIASAATAMPDVMIAIATTAIGSR